MALQKREHFLIAIIACLVLGGHLVSAQWRQTGPGTQPRPGARPGQGGQGWTPGQGARPGQGGQGWTPGQGARPGQGGQGWTPGQGARPGQGGQGWTPGQGARPGQGGPGPFIPRREPLTPMMTCGDVSLYGGAAGTTPIPMAKHCLDIRELGGVRDGVYTIYVSELNSCGKVNVYCDQTTDGGGWTVIQRRVDGRLNFLRNWQEYKDGFGFLNGEFWLGNEWIHKIAMQGPHELRVDLGDFQMNERFAKYKVFSVGNERSNYTLKVERYDTSSNAGDALTGHNNQAFTTIDRDNDRWSGNCARQYTGAWWYTSCHNSNLNGGYLKGANRQYARGVVWNQWRGYSYSLRSTEMKIRPLI
ncbi:microfibril-associated glycoprotein 4-like [Diadema setosum]|uniref:microfibril-associated glycoprotein 4-like n=1 Tax=Diadema setosum TaxID=31175 RepID=UPI003B3A9CFA